MSLSLHIARTYLVAATLLSSSCGSSSSAPTPQTRPDIILISIDSLRPDHLGCYGYKRNTSPTIDRLAREGVRFVNAVSTTSWTLPAHAALFTGLYDSAHGVVNIDDQLADEHLTMAEILRNSGYQTVGFYGGPFLHPTYGLDQGFDAYFSCMTKVPEDADEQRYREFPVHDASHQDITGPRTLDRFNQWFSTISPQPFFLFLHLWDVHYDYTPPKRFIDLFDPDYTGTITADRYMKNPDITLEMSQRDFEHVLALYDGEIRFTDEILGQILKKLEEAGRLNNALVIVTSDHGEEFFEHGAKGHQTSLFEEVVRVPLIFYYPQRLKPGLVILDQARLIDVLPTVLELAQVNWPIHVQGRDLSPVFERQKLIAEPALLELLVFTQRIRGLRTNDYKVLVDQNLGQTAFYDLRTDPHELTNTTVGGGKENPTYVRALANLGEVTKQNNAYRELTLVAPPKKATISNSMKRRLESLGYVGGPNGDSSHGQTTQTGEAKNH